MARRLTTRLVGGTLVVDGPWGGWKGGSGDPTVRVEVHDIRAFRALLTGGSRGLADSYVAGWWDVDDLTGLIELLLASTAGALARLDGAARRVDAIRSLVERAHAPTMEADRTNVQAHYDLPGVLFETMLDETMTYSCALFERPDQSLADAQRAKLDRICVKLGLGPDDRVLEIGTGWGAFALHAAATYGCSVTTTTISESQRREARRRVEAAGLSDRVEVLGADYRELTGTYDKLVSIEMVEAVDWRRHATFFATCRRLLRPDGLMALQAIVIADRSFERAKHRDDFIKDSVFPGSCIPSVTSLLTSLTGATDLRLVDLEDIGRHYAATLRSWRHNLQQGWDRLAEAAGFGAGFHRKWELYLSYCEAAFLQRHISDVQMILAGPDWRSDLAIRK